MTDYIQTQEKTVVYYQPELSKARIASVVIAWVHRESPMNFVFSLIYSFSAKGYSDTRTITGTNVRKKYTVDPAY